MLINTYGLKSANQIFAKLFQIEQQLAFDGILVAIQLGTGFGCVAAGFPLLQRGHQISFPVIDEALRRLQK